MAIVPERWLKALPVRQSASPFISAPRQPVQDLCSTQPSGEPGRTDRQDQWDGGVNPPEGCMPVPPAGTHTSPLAKSISWLPGAHTAPGLRCVLLNTSGAVALSCCSLLRLGPTWLGREAHPHLLVDVEARSRTPQVRLCYPEQHGALRGAVPPWLPKTC